MQCLCCQRVVNTTRLVHMRQRVLQPAPRTSQFGRFFEDDDATRRTRRSQSATERATRGKRTNPHIRFRRTAAVTNNTRQRRSRSQPPFRRAFVCEGCYAALELLERYARRHAPYLTLKYELAERSRHDCARRFDAARYACYQRRLAGRMGILLE